MWNVLIPWSPTCTTVHNELKDYIFPLAKVIIFGEWWAYLDASLDGHDCNRTRFTSSFCGKSRQRDGWKTELYFYCAAVQRVWVRKFRRSPLGFWKVLIKMQMVSDYGVGQVVPNKQFNILRKIIVCFRVSCEDRYHSHVCALHGAKRRLA